MPLLKGSEIIEDSWTMLDDEAEIPTTGDIIVSSQRLKDELDTLLIRDGDLGVYLANSEDATILAPYIDKVALIALDFPAFTDGRAYSQARIITTQLGYTGELRATGNVLADQGVFMSQCGFDSFEIDKRQSPHLWAKISNSMSLAYQRGYRGRIGVAPREVLTARGESVAR